MYSKSHDNPMSHSKYLVFIFLKSFIPKYRNLGTPKSPREDQIEYNEYLEMTLFCFTNFKIGVIEKQVKLDFIFYQEQN